MTEEYIRRSAFVGFLAAETGCFGFEIQDHDGKGDFGVYVYPVFSLGRTERKRGIIEELHDTFGVGSIQSVDGQPYLRYVVKGFDDCRVIQDTIESYSTKLFECADKYDRYEKWCQIMDEYEGYETKDELHDFIVDARSLNPESPVTSISPQGWMQIIEEYED